MRFFLSQKKRFLWTVWADFCGVVAIATVVGWTGFASQERHVSIHTNQRLITHIVKIGQPLEYLFDVDRKNTTDGHIEDIFERTNGLEREQIRIIHPLRTTEVKKYPDTHFFIDLPARVTEGHWHYKSTLVSDCQILSCEDLIIEFDFDVVP